MSVSLKPFQGGLHRKDQISQITAMFRILTDPRKKRGVRHPSHSLRILLKLLKMYPLVQVRHPSHSLRIGLYRFLARNVGMPIFIRWAKVHWDRLREPPVLSDKSRPARHVFRVPRSSFLLKNFGKYSPNGSNLKSSKHRHVLSVSILIVHIWRFRP